MRRTSSRTPSKSKEVNPKFYVFCEGETEQAYVEYLKAKYRVPVQIIAELSKSKISEKYIQNIHRNHHPRDRDYFMYDADVPYMLERLMMLSQRFNAVPVISNPCIELWFLLHFAEHLGSINSKDCERLLRDKYARYKKGRIDDRLAALFDLREGQALARARRMTSGPYTNPSTQIYRLIEDLNRATGVEEVVDEG